MNAETGPRTGVWIVGARGAVATTTIVGARAAALGLSPLRGVTTEGPRGEGLALPGASALVFGGWELRAGSLLDAAADLAEGRIFNGRVLEALAADLAAIDRDIVRGGTRGVPPPCGAATPAEVIARLAAIRELAEREGVPFAGTDGKTGETLVKSALASLFRERDLQVLSWHGENLLGNADGAALSEPEVKAAKVESKDGVVRGVLGY